MVIEVHVDAAEAIGDLRATPERLAKAITAALSRTATRGQSIMREEIAARVSHAATGHMARTVGVEVSGDSATIGPKVDYAKWTNDPTRPHEIRAKNGRALALPLGWAQFKGAVKFGQGGTRSGSRVFVNGRFRQITSATGATAHFFVRVHHPGTKGLHFAEATRDRLEPEAQDIFAEEVQRQLKGASS